MKRNITCPCGEHIAGDTEDDLVEKTQAHLRENHPGHEYSRDEILFMAY
jgi:predicted small metal-binding protein